MERYEDVKEELYEYFMRVNAKDDAKILRQKQIEIIESMNSKLQTILTQLLLNGPVANYDALWVDNDEHKHDSLAQIMHHEQQSNEQLVEITQRLCMCMPTIELETTFCVLAVLDQSYTRISSEEYFRQTFGDEIDDCVSSINSV